MIATLGDVRDMIIVMQAKANQQQVDTVVERIVSMGYRPHVSQGEETTIVGVIGHSSPEQLSSLELLPGVDHMVQVTNRTSSVVRDFRPRDTLVPVNGATFGSERVVVIAGPCSIESEEQLWETASAVKASGATVLRAGAFKPRTSPYSFQGLGEEGLVMLDARSKGTWTRGRDRGSHARSRRHGGRICRYVADRRTQYAKLCSVTRGGAEWTSGAVEARHERDHRGVAYVSRVHPGQRQ